MVGLLRFNIGGISPFVVYSLHFLMFSDMEVNLSGYFFWLVFSITSKLVQIYNEFFPSFKKIMWIFLHLSYPFCVFEARFRFK